MFRLVLGFHCHLPVGTPAETVDQAVAGAYWPLVKALEELTGVTITVPAHPRTAVALGAAIRASLKKEGRRRRRMKIAD